MTGDQPTFGRSDGLRFGARREGQQRSERCQAPAQGIPDFFTNPLGNRLQTYGPIVAKRLSKKRGRAAVPTRPEFREETPVTRQEEDDPLPAAYFGTIPKQGNEENGLDDGFLRMSWLNLLIFSAYCARNERRAAHLFIAPLSP
ncbi:hypothetical protein [Elioraea thermophila]|uniref:hypothetical protein n=1 Tax=Elioraea thermophila TaxID=2185104 RepID=UPI0013004221|nr:hypothetical protein [Elioraea thermophila]